MVLIVDIHVAGLRGKARWYCKSRLGRDLEDPLVMRIALAVQCGHEIPLFHILILPVGLKVPVMLLVDHAS